MFTYGDVAGSRKDRSPAFDAEALDHLGTLQALSRRMTPDRTEADDLVFDDIVSLSWDLEAMAGHYHVYRAGPMGAPAGVAPVGDCLLGDVTATTASDPSAPAPGRAYFYFVNAVNCIGVEGPNGTIGMGCP